MKHPSGYELANAIALEILRWEDRGGMWFRGASPTGLKVARSMSDFPQGGFFRPDRNLFHVQLIDFAVQRDTSARYKTKFPGKDIEVMYSDGDLQTTVRDENDLILGTGNEAIALAAYLFVKAWREENLVP